MAHHIAPNVGSPARGRPIATHAEIIAVPEAIAHDIASHVDDEEIADVLGDEQLQGATREAAQRIEKEQIIA